jgi:hypothetical protein
VLSDYPPGRSRAPADKTGQKGENLMIALVALLLILAIFGGLGFAAHLLWIVLLVALALWVLGFFVRAVERGGRRSWYGR